MAIELVFTYEINIKPYFGSHGFYSRKIWEKLFRILGLAELKCFDSFLCDLRCFERIMDDGKYEFYWQYSMSGWTDTKVYYPHEDCFRIHVIPNEKILITKIKEKS